MATGLIDSRVVSGSPEMALRKPARLEALPVVDRKRKTAAGDLHTFELI